MTKLRLTESQFNLIQQLNETDFGTSVGQNIKAGDYLYIQFNDGTVNHFKVIDSSSGQIIMDNIDKGGTNYNYRYWFGATSLSGGDVLKLKRVHKTKERDLIKNIRDWKPFSIKNIKKFIVLDGSGQVKDEIDIDPTITPSKIKSNKPVNKEPETTKPPTEDEALKDELNDFIAEIIKLKEDYTITFDMTDGSTLTFCAVSKNRLAYELELVYSTGNREKYNYLKNYRIVMEFNESVGQNELDEILTSNDDGKTKALMIYLISGESKKRSYIDFISFSLGGTCADLEEKMEDRKERMDNDGEGNSEEIMKMVLSDPLLKKAFISTPKLFNLIKIGDPKGLLPAQDLLDKYVEKKNKERIGDDSDKFKVQHKILYEIVDHSFQKKFSEKDEINLKLGEKYVVRVKSFTYKDKTIVLYSSKPAYKFYIKKALGNDVFKAVLVKDYVAKNGARESFTENVTIRVLDYNY